MSLQLGVLVTINPLNANHGAGMKICLHDRVILWANVGILIPAPWFAYLNGHGFNCYVTNDQRVHCKILLNVDDLEVPPFRKPPHDCIPTKMVIGWCVCVCGLPSLQNGKPLVQHQRFRTDKYRKSAPSLDRLHSQNDVPSH